MTIWTTRSNAKYRAVKVGGMATALADGAKVKLDSDCLESGEKSNAGTLMRSCMLM